MAGIFDTGIFDTGIYDHAAVAEEATVGVLWRDRAPARLADMDDRDLVEIMPIVIGALNASRTH